MCRATYGARQIAEVAVHDALEGGKLLLERLAADTGIKIVRYPSGSVMPAHTSCKTATSAANGLVSSVEVTARKVRAEELVL